jgi:nitroreductase
MERLQSKCLIERECLTPSKVKLHRIGGQTPNLAVNAAIQNMLLIVHPLRLGAIWRTGSFAYHPKMKALFGLREKDQVVGFIYGGYPECHQRKENDYPPLQKEQRGLKQMTAIHPRDSSDRISQDRELPVYL